MFRTILPVMARTAPGNGAPTPKAVEEALEMAKPMAVITRALRHMIKRGEWGTALFDPESREMVLAPQDDDIQARESFNADRLRYAEEVALNTGLRRPLSPEADPTDLHRSEIDRLNSIYTKSTFGAVMNALRQVAHQQARAQGLCSMAEIDRRMLEQEIVSRSGVLAGDVSAVMGDLVFTFDPRQDGEQFLVELEPARVAIIPLLVVERTLDETEYIRISKTRYSAAYTRYQEELTTSLEARVGDALRAHAPYAEVRSLKLPSTLAAGIGGQIDRVASDPDEDALLLVQVKYLLDHDNNRIAEGLAQLRRDESVVREQWSEVAQRLNGWRGRDCPAHLGKLLVTNWFLGTEPVQDGIRVLALDDLRGIPPAGNVRVLIERLKTLPEPTLVPKHENRVCLFGYTFTYYTAAD
jgi:hypothetical protein